MIPFNKSILICTPGRCGSHWLMGVLTELLGLKVVPTKMFDPYNFENSISVAHNLSAVKATVEDPFCSEFKHIPDRLNLFEYTNVIVLVRDPRDICVSASFYMEKKHHQSTHLKEYLKKGLHNPVFFEAYKAERNNFKHFFIRFEEVLQEPHIINDMLDYFEYICDSEKLNYLIDKYSFKNLQRFDSTHYRKGIVGDWKNHLTDQQNDEFCERHVELMNIFGYSK